MADIRNLRINYGEKKHAFTKSDLVAKEPIAQFSHWMNEALATQREPNACCLATASKTGRPSNRMVLLKTFDENGFKFCTNFESKKGADLAENPVAAGCFYWKDSWLDGSARVRQVRVEGPIRRAPREESEKYFHSRPKSSQLSACVSKQSHVVESRDKLQEKVKELEEKFQDGVVPCPPHWGMFTLEPEVVEFWQGQTDRLHDRIRYRKINNGIEDDWKIERLQP